MLRVSVAAAAVAGAVDDEQPVIRQPLGDPVPVAAQPGLAVDEEDRVAPAAVNDERTAQDARPRHRGSATDVSPGRLRRRRRRRDGRDGARRLGVGGGDLHDEHRTLRPGRVSTRALPPWAPARAATIDSPSPVPSPVRASLPR